MKIKKYLEQSPLFIIQLAYENIVSNLNRELKSENLNLLQAFVLTALFFEDREDVTPSQLADLFQTTRGNISHIISHLEAYGWVKRSVNKSDARHFHLTLKAEGRKKTLNLIKIFDRIQDRFENEIGIYRNRKAIENIQLWIQIFKENNSIFQ
jgi:DNA-binding MarR family transcriptional regulator